MDNCAWGVKQNVNTKTEVTLSCLTNRFISIFTTKLDKKIVIVSYSERGHTTYHMQHAYSNTHDRSTHTHTAQHGTRSAPHSIWRRRCHGTRTGRSRLLYGDCYDGRAHGFEPSPPSLVAVCFCSVVVHQWLKFRPRFNLFLVESWPTYSMFSLIVFEF